jgi:hypothetical protein
MFHVPMFSAIRSSHRPASLITRVTAALPHLPHRSSHWGTSLISRVTAALRDLPHPHRKRHRRVGAAAMVRAVAGLVGVLIGTAAVIFRGKLMSIGRRRNGGKEQAADVAEVSRGDGGEEQAPDAAEHKLTSIVRAAEHKLASIVSHDGGDEQAPNAAAR